MIIPNKCPKSWEKTVKQKMALFGEMDKVAMSIVNLNSLVEAKRLVDKYSSIIEILEKADIADFIFIRDSRKEKV